MRPGRRLRRLLWVHSDTLITAVKGAPMRTPHWLTPLAICFVVLLAGSQSATAQFPGGGGPPAGINAQGLPPGSFNPYPGISPFENTFSRTYNNQGTWFNDSRGAAARARNWKFNIDFLRAEVRSLDGLVGSRNAQTYLDLAQPSGLLPAGAGFFNYFDAADATAISDLTSSGLKLGGGFTNADSSGFEWDVTWNRESNAKFNARKIIESNRFDDVVDREELRRLNLNGGILDNQRLFQEFRNERDIVEALLSGPNFQATNFLPLNTQEILEANIFNLNGLPLDNGTFGGVTQPYDLDFILTHQHQSFGGRFGFLMAPILEGRLTVRPVVGARYLFIDEGFRFDGVDSNALYDGNADGVPTPDIRLHSLPNGVDEDGDFITDNAGLDEANPTVPSFDQLQGGFITSFLANNVTTHLIGPELALRYDLGNPQGRGFNLSGQTKVGALLNSDRVDLRGDNIGAIIRFDPTMVDPDPNGNGGFLHTEIFDITEDNPNPNAFSDSKRTTHLSPSFEQSFNAEIPIFRNIPMLNRVRQLQGARLRLGYSWLWVGEVASPNQSILWQANPQAGIFPRIDLEREDYSIQTLSFGLDWAF